MILLLLRFYIGRGNDHFIGTATKYHTTISFGSVGAGEETGNHQVDAAMIIYIYIRTYMYSGKGT